MPLLERPGTEIPERGMSPLALVEHLQVLEQVRARVAHAASRSSTLSVAKKLSATALVPGALPHDCPYVREPVCASPCSRCFPDTGPPNWRDAALRKPLMSTP